MFLCPSCAGRFPVPPDAGLSGCPLCGASYRSEEGILILGDAQSPGDYPQSAYEKLFDVEDRHFWFSGRNRVILAALRAAVGRVRGLRALEVGCGTGQVLACLEQHGVEVCGLDMHLEGLRFARRRTHATLVCSDAMAMPFKDEFDLTLLCDVIEHVEDHIAVVKKCLAATRPGGFLLVTVPAGMWLWSFADEYGSHKRRYADGELAELLTTAGAEVRLLRYFNSLITPALFLRRCITGRRRPSGPDEAEEFAETELRIPPWPLNGMLDALIRLEAAWLPRLSFPFGASLVAVAQRRAES